MILDVEIEYYLLQSSLVMSHRLVISKVIYIKKNRFMNNIFFHFHFDFYL